MYLARKSIQSLQLIMILPPERGHVGLCQPFTLLLAGLNPIWAAVQRLLHAAQVPREKHFSRCLWQAVGLILPESCLHVPAVLLYTLSQAPCSHKYAFLDTHSMTSQSLCFTP